MKTKTGRPSPPAPDEPPFGVFRPYPHRRALLYWTRTRSDRFLGRKVVAFVRAVLRRSMSGPLDMEVLGQRMRLHLHDNSCERRLIFCPQYFDPGGFAWLDEMLKPGKTFVDLGANIGAYSLFAASRVGPEGRIVAVEPNPVAVARLAFNLRCNGFDNVAIERCAVSDRRGKAFLAVPDDNFGRGSIAGDDHMTGEGKPIKIRTERLLDIFRKHRLSDVSVLKIDVEGTEDQALLPFFDSAPQKLWPESIIIEVSGANNWKTDCVAGLKDRGYRQVLHSPPNLVLTRR